jgi:membrane protein YqaA with SNARE-associated domain
MADYIVLALTVFVINVIPLFMPPSWFILAYAKVNDPSFDPLWLAVVGAVASTTGRAVLASYSSLFRRYFSHDLAQRADEIKQFFERKGKQLFIGSLTYSLSPLPSSMLFIADGLTKVDPRPVLAGYFVGRLASYYVIVALSHDLFMRVNGYFHGSPMVQYAFDLIGILGAFSILLIDWKKVVGMKAKPQ